MICCNKWKSDDIRWTKDKNVLKNRLNKASRV